MNDEGWALWLSLIDNLALAPAVRVMWRLDLPVRVSCEWERRRVQTGIDSWEYARFRSFRAFVGSSVAQHSKFCCYRLELLALRVNPKVGGSADGPPCYQSSTNITI